MEDNLRTDYTVLIFWVGIGFLLVSRKRAMVTAGMPTSLPLRDAISTRGFLYSCDVSSRSLFIYFIFKYTYPPLLYTLDPSDSINPTHPLTPSHHLQKFFLPCFWPLCYTIVITHHSIVAPIRRYHLLDQSRTVCIISFPLRKIVVTEYI